LQRYEYSTIIKNIKLRETFLDETQRLIDALIKKGYVEVALMHAKKRKQLIDEMTTADELLGRLQLD
jgi:hypothetical protein